MTVITSGSTAARDLSLFNLRRAEIICDPHPFYRRLREHGRVHWDPYVRSWIVTGYTPVARLLRDRRLSAAMRHTDTIATVAPPEMRRAFELLDRHMTFADPSDHARLRATVAQPFRPRIVAGLHDQIAAVVDSLLEKMADRGDRIDFVSAFGCQLPLRIVAQLLGLKGVTVEQLRTWAAGWGDVVGSFGHVPDDAQAQARNAADLAHYLQTVIDRHRTRPRRDVTDALIAAVDAGQMDADELLGNMMIVLIGGHDTTASLLGSAVSTMLRQPEIACELRQRPEHVPAAVEEFLRLDSPTQYVARTATADLDIDGATVRAGDSVVLMLAAANRDPAVFPDPDQFRLDRPPPHHLAFGHGPYVCFGAPLARLEATIALTAITGRIRGLRPAGDPRWRMNGNLRGLDRLPVHLDQVVPATQEQR
ncbi:cytochrome P450 [Streptomyces sp. 7N604]|uniref:cytochrome P450 n=1 Tax=Streptomyces sp. 7N604 TaxID=3457415 RepID=UPI003FCF27B6